MNFMSLQHFYLENKVHLFPIGFSIGKLLTKVSCIFQNYWLLLSGCFWLFAPKFWEVGGPVNCHFVLKGIQLPWWWQCEVVGTFKPY